MEAELSTLRNTIETERQESKVLMEKMELEVAERKLSFHNLQEEMHHLLEQLEQAGQAQAELQSRHSALEQKHNAEMEEKTSHILSLRKSEQELQSACDALKDQNSKLLQDKNEQAAHSAQVIQQLEGQYLSAFEAHLCSTSVAPTLKFQMSLNDIICLLNQGIYRRIKKGVSSEPFVAFLPSLTEVITWPNIIIIIVLKTIDSNVSNFKICYVMHDCGLKGSLTEMSRIWISLWKTQAKSSCKGRETKLYGVSLTSKDGSECFSYRWKFLFKENFYPLRRFKENLFFKYVIIKVLIIHDSDLV